MIRADAPAGSGAPFAALHVASPNLPFALRPDATPLADIDSTSQFIVREATSIELNNLFRLARMWTCPGDQVGMRPSVTIKNPGPLTPAWMTMPTDVFRERCTAHGMLNTTGNRRNKTPKPKLK
jgi:hypothetical protein